MAQLQRVEAASTRSADAARTVNGAASSACAYGPCPLPQPQRGVLFFLYVYPCRRQRDGEPNRLRRFAICEGAPAMPNQSVQTR